MAINKKQLTFGIVAIIIIIAVAVWFFVKRSFNSAADEVDNQSINSTVSATYESGNNTYTVSSSTLSIKYTNVDMPVIESINLEENQVIKTNPYIILVKAAKPEDVSRIDFYVDDNLIGSSTLPDVEGYFEGVWDTLKYHSLVKLVVYDNFGRTQEITRNVTVDLSSISNDTNNPNNPNSPIYQSKPIKSVLPKTGMTE